MKAKKNKKKKHGGRKKRPGRKTTKCKPSKSKKSSTESRKSKSKSKKAKKTKTTKRKRGRPKGSKNKKTNKIKKVKGKRGRPKGSKNKRKKLTKKEKEALKKQIKEDFKNVKRSKFVGYCPSTECGAMIMKKDFISKFVFICGSCGLRARSNKLISQETKERRTQEYQNKSEYISDTRNTEFVDMPEMKPKVEKIEVIP